MKALRVFPLTQSQLLLQIDYGLSYRYMESLVQQIEFHEFVESCWRRAR